MRIVCPYCRTENESKEIPATRANNFHTRKCDRCGLVWDLHDSGGVWEFPEWEVHYTPEADSSCHHSREGGMRRIVVAKNEGGYCRTGICLDCILERYGGSKLK